MFDEYKNQIEAHIENEKERIIEIEKGIEDAKLKLEFQDGVYGTVCKLFRKKEAELEAAKESLRKVKLELDRYFLEGK